MKSFITFIPIFINFPLSTSLSEKQYAIKFFIYFLSVGMAADHPNTNKTNLINKKKVESDTKMK